MTQDELVLQLQQLGLQWKRANLSALEGGTRSRAAVADLVLLGVALSCGMHELLSGSEEIALAPGVPPVGLVSLRKFMQGGAAPEVLESRLHPDSGAKELRELPPAERDMARRLQVPSAWVLDAAQALWGRSLTEERDARVEAMEGTTKDNRRTRRAAVTKELEMSIQKRVEKKQLGLNYD